jgi:plastocyanin
MSITRRTLSLSLAAAAASGPALAAPKTVEVSMDRAKMLFLPEVVKIKAGDTVRWVNPTGVFHSATFDPAKVKDPRGVSLPAGAEPFDSGKIDEDESYSHVFTVKGTYRYVCKYHQNMGMVGTVIVG